MKFETFLLLFSFFSTIFLWVGIIIWHPPLMIISLPGTFYNVFIKRGK
jgi:hypothetical protein